MIIKITTDNQVIREKFPQGTMIEQNTQLRTFIGTDCTLYEHVMPRRLYSLFDGHMNSRSTVSMLVDEDGLFNGLDVNKVACWLYESDVHGYPILGNALIVGEKRTADGYIFCDIPENIAESLKSKLEQIALNAHKICVAAVAAVLQGVLGGCAP